MAERLCFFFAPGFGSDESLFAGNAFVADGADFAVQNRAGGGLADGGPDHRVEALAVDAVCAACAAEVVFVRDADILESSKPGLALAAGIDGLAGLAIPVPAIEALDVLHGVIVQPELDDGVSGASQQGAEP